jgi:hypothetical protein
MSLIRYDSEKGMLTLVFGRWVFGEDSGGEEASWSCVDR